MGKDKTRIITCINLDDHVGAVIKDIVMQPEFVVEMRARSAALDGCPRCSSPGFSYTDPSVFDTSISKLMTKHTAWCSGHYSSGLSDPGLDPNEYGELPVNYFRVPYFSNICSCGMHPGILWALISVHFLEEVHCFDQTAAKKASTISDEIARQIIDDRLKMLEEPPFPHVHWINWTARTLIDTHDMTKGQCSAVIRSLSGKEGPETKLILRDVWLGQQRLEVIARRKAFAHCRACFRKYMDVNVGELLDVFRICMCKVSSSVPSCSLLNLTLLVRGLLYPLVL